LIDGGVGLLSAGSLLSHCFRAAFALISRNAAGDLS
jgi:hypothetical protein